MLLLAMLLWKISIVNLSLYQTKIYLNDLPDFENEHISLKTKHNSKRGSKFSIV